MTLGTYVQEFRQVVDDIYGTFLDAREGFAKVRESGVNLDTESRRTFEEDKKRRPDLANLEYGGLEYSYGRHLSAGSPPWSGHLHQVPIATLIDRNTDAGTNSRFIANMCVVTLFQLWEERYRPLFAQFLNVDKNDLTCPVFGDLRWLRHAIIHNNGIATSDTERCEILRWFKRGELLYFSRAQFEEVVDRILSFLRELEAHPTLYVRRV